MEKIMTPNGGILTIDHQKMTASFSFPNSCFHTRVDYQEACKESRCCGYVRVTPARPTKETGSK